MIDTYTGLKMGKLFTLLYWTENNMYFGRLKDVPGIHSQGKSLDELKMNIRETYNLMIDEERESLPDHVRDIIKEIQIEI